VTPIDLLYEATQAKQIIGEFQPAMTEDSYFAFAWGVVKEGAIFSGGDKAAILGYILGY
jgi:hypothetical protein